jgi:hypothetical protein
MVLRRDEAEFVATHNDHYKTGNPKVKRKTQKFLLHRNIQLADEMRVARQTGRSDRENHLQS